MKQIKIIALCTIALTSIALMSFTTTGKFPVHLTVPNEIKVLWAEESHDFGEIPQGKPASVEFSFTNKGEEPLIITNVTTGCGCTAPEYTKAPVAAGKSSKIKGTYNAAAMGAFSKAITVNFVNDGSQKVLLIKGTVK